MKFNLRNCFSVRKMISLRGIASPTLETWCDAESRQVHTICCACVYSVCILSVYGRLHAAIARPICNESHLNLTFSPLPILCLFVYKQAYVWREEGRKKYGSLRKTWGAAMCVSERDAAVSLTSHGWWVTMLEIWWPFWVGRRSALWCCLGVRRDK
jgi:hypothetical protein